MVPAVILGLMAFSALPSGQVRAEVELEELDVVVCDGLSSLTMGVNAGTLRMMGELTQSTHSSDGECKMSLTLFDVSGGLRHGRL